MTIDIATRVWRLGSMYIARALPLDVSSAGATPDAARAALREAIALFVATARDLGTIEEVLEECGYTQAHERWHAPAIEPGVRESLVV